MLRYLKQEPTVLQKLRDEQKQVCWWDMQNPNIVLSAVSYYSLSEIIRLKLCSEISCCTRVKITKQDRQCDKTAASLPVLCPAVQARRLHTDSLSPLRIEITPPPPPPFPQI